MSDHLGIIPTLSHEQYLAATGVSHSHLKVIRDQSPAHLWTKLNTPEVPTESQRIGTLTHRCLLLPDTLDGAFWVKPEDMSFATKEGKAWRAEHSDRPIVTHAEWSAAVGMRDAVWKHPTAKRLLSNARYEQSVFVNDSQGTLRKLRPDVLPNGGNILPDIKTCESASEEDFTRTIGNFHYFSQGAWYLDGCKLAGMEFENFVLIAVEKTPPYAVACYVVDPVAIQYGRMLNNRDLAVYRQCIETNTWPAYSDKIEFIGLPKWMQKEAEAMA